jgi:hypothetical protein
VVTFVGFSDKFIYAFFIYAMYDHLILTDFIFLIMFLKEYKL